MPKSNERSVVTMTVNGGNSVVLWQTPQDKDTPVGEQAIVLHKYADCLEFSQEGRKILVTLECVPEFLRTIKLMMDGKL